jgi:hypothetical protein
MSFACLHACLDADKYCVYSFVVIFNKKNAKQSDLAPAPQTIEFKEQDVILTFAGDMMAAAAPTTNSATARTLGACFACQAPSEQRVLQAIRAHENTAKVSTHKLARVSGWGLICTRTRGCGILSR